MEGSVDGSEDGSPSRERQTLRNWVSERKKSGLGEF